MKKSIKRKYVLIGALIALTGIILLWYFTNIIFIGDISYWIKVSKYL